MKNLFTRPLTSVALISILVLGTIVMLHKSCRAAERTTPSPRVLHRHSLSLAPASQDGEGRRPRAYSLASASGVEDEPSRAASRQAFCEAHGWLEGNLEKIFSSVNCDELRRDLDTLCPDPTPEPVVTALPISPVSVRVTSSAGNAFPRAAPDPKAPAPVPPPVVRVAPPVGNAFLNAASDTKKWAAVVTASPKSPADVRVNSSAGNAFPSATSDPKKLAAAVPNTPASSSASNDFLSAALTYTSLCRLGSDVGKEELLFLNHIVGNSDDVDEEIKAFSILARVLVKKLNPYQPSSV